VQLLLAKGVNPEDSIRDDNGIQRTALSDAIRDNHLKIARILLDSTRENKATVTEERLIECLEANYSDTKMLELLLEHYDNSVITEKFWKCRYSGVWSANPGYMALSSFSRSGLHVADDVESFRKGFSIP
jgi:hypothetical protein